MDQKRKVGRPRLPDSEKQRYQRVAMKPESHARFKQIADDSGNDLVDVIDDASKKISKQHITKKTV